jgi:hypothetical protein
MALGPGGIGAPLVLARYKYNKMSLFVVPRLLTWKSPNYLSLRSGNGKYEGEKTTAKLKN